MIGHNITILGMTVIEERSLILDNVVIGFPARGKLLQLKVRAEKSPGMELLDSVSDGSYIGRDVVIRTGCVIYERVKIGDNVELGHNVLIREETEIGDNCRIGSGTVIEGHVKIGRNVVIQSGVYIPIGTIIEDNVFIGPYVVFTNDKYPPSRRLTPVKVRKGAVVGAGAVILPGVEIGENAVIGAGAIVSRDVPPETVVVGVPARELYKLDVYVKKREEYEQELRS